MKRLIAAVMLCQVALVVSAAPAVAGDRYYDGWGPRYWGGDYGQRSLEREYYYVERRPHGGPVEAPHFYVPYGSYYADYYREKPHVAAPYWGEGECTIKRKWRNGRMKETIKCDDD